MRSATPMPWAPFSRSRTEAFLTIRSWVSCLCSLEYRMRLSLNVEGHLITRGREKSPINSMLAAPHHRKSRRRVHCEIALAIAHEAFHVAVLAAKLDHFSLRR